MDGNDKPRVKFFRQIPKETKNMIAISNIFVAQHSVEKHEFFELLIFFKRCSSSPCSSVPWGRTP